MIGRIYKLVHPDSKKVIYVGSTKRPLKDRLKEHISSISTDNHPIYDYLHGNKIRPLIELIEEINVPTSKDLYERECHWIDTLVAAGESLLNKARKAPKFSGSLRVDFVIYDRVKQVCQREGMSITRFYDIAAEERLKRFE